MDTSDTDSQYAYTTLDLVCSQYSLRDRLNPLPKMDWHGHITNSWLLSLLLFAAIASYLAAAGLIIVHLNLANPDDLLLAVVLITGGLVGIPAILYNQNKIFPQFPSNLQLDGEGFRFFWRDSEERMTRKIPWTCVRKVAANETDFYLTKEGNKGTILDLSLDLRWMSLRQRLWFLWQAQSLWTSAFPLGALRGSHPLVLKFPLESFTLDADKYRMLSALQTRVSGDCLGAEFTSIAQLSSAPTYTQLWLDDLQSFRRANLGDLAADALLQDGRYKIEYKIATGGQAKLYLAQDTEENKAVALKELVLPINAGADVRNRSFGNVKSEALLLAKLDHPQIVKLLDNFVEDHRAYIVMEHLEGRTLRTLVQQDGVIKPKNTKALAMQICDILKYLHEQSPPIVHRDLTPDNLILPADGNVRLIDFNVAQQLESDNTRTVVGKHNYMAPEQFKGKPCPQSDLYSLGCTLYFCLTGKDPVPLSSSRPSALCDVPEELDDVVAKLTAIDLAQRFPSAAAVLAELG